VPQRRELANGYTGHAVNPYPIKRGRLSMGA
jgi:hypothetical protein